MKILPKIITGTLIIIVVVFGISLFTKNNVSKNILPLVTNTPSAPNSPLNIDYMRSQSYPGSDIKIEQTLTAGSNYNRYIVSFIVATSDMSDGLKEYAYLTVPKTHEPSDGFPVIIFNHGYQIPALYTPEGNYIPHMDALSKAGYIVFKPDYRGNGKSEGAPGSTYYSPNYAIDDLNAIASIKKFSSANPKKIGIWGHSMGGNISLRVSEASADIKVVVIWGGVVGSYNDIIYNWQDKVSYKPASEDLYLRNLGLSTLLAANGTPTQNPTFWNSIDPTFNLNYVNAPFQIHVGLSDPQVPPSFSKSLYDKLVSSKKYAEYYEYPGANHDINQSFSKAMKRTISFFDKYLK
jgi:dipeptidyl aminopeptidase/acylaminoacyl peptidase